MPAPSAINRSWSQAGQPPVERALQFKPGDRVNHGLFGDGVVLKAELTIDDEEVTVAFPGKGTKTLLASFAKLRRVAG
jgi:DNA helicase-2/ATP-dependent DNA helicase PcrA